MKRKTNLFYTEGPDSKFITFSNYTEALTGNYLSVSSKLFPNIFLCLKIGKLNNVTKPYFIKYLVRYYENKLAVLRDGNINNNENIENDIYPLAYLLEAILNVVEFNDKTGMYELRFNDPDNFNSDLKVDYIRSFGDNEYRNLITYIGDISETDYYGTYTDIICNIDCSQYKTGTIINKSLNEIYNEKSISLINKSYITNNLYGWDSLNYSNTMYSTYKYAYPIYDNEYTYLYKSSVSEIVINNINNVDNLEFNVIIPLFSLVDINDSVNYNSNKFTYSIMINDGNCHSFNVPLGMWIYADKENDSFIKLEKDPNLNLFPNWSLLISSQFKPFPYSTKYTQNIETTNNTSSNSIANTFSTFAEVLSKTNDVLNNFNKISIDINTLNNRIEQIEQQLKEVGTLENIQKINETVTVVEHSVNNQLAEFKKQMYSYLTNLRWSDENSANLNI